MFIHHVLWYNSIGLVRDEVNRILSLVLQGDRHLEAGLQMVVHNQDNEVFLREILQEMLAIGETLR